MDTTPAAGQRAVQELASHYRAKARSVARAGVVGGALVGLVVGSVPLTPLRFAWPIPERYGVATVLAGIATGILIGYVIGDGRAGLYRRMAEQARLQLRLEERLAANDARISRLVAELQTVRASAPPAPQPAPVPAAPPPPVPHLRVAPPPLAPPLTPPVSS
ncbi:MAG TPA: hypothetical protein VIA10_05315 [Gaiellaceae bacterium]|jgi:hypothetical protein